MDLNFKVSPVLLDKTNACIDEKTITSAFGDSLPKWLIEFWNSYYEILFSNGIHIYGFEIAIERNKIYNICDTPEFIMIGDDGSGQGIFIKKNFSSMKIFHLGLCALGSLPFETLHDNFFEWLENVPEIFEDDLDNDFDLTENVKVFVVKAPKNEVKFIFDLRKSLNLEISIS